MVTKVKDRPYFFVIITGLLKYSLKCLVNKQPKLRTSASQSTTSSCQLQSVTIAPRENNLSVSIDDFSESVITRIEILKVIWNKVSELLRDPNSISFAPGQDSIACVVRSHSGPRPHLVTRKRNGQYACDNVCPNWKSLGICAHSAAEDNSPTTTVCQLVLKIQESSKCYKIDDASWLWRSRAPPEKKSKVQGFPFLWFLECKKVDVIGAVAHHTNHCLQQLCHSHGQRGESAIINMSIENAKIVVTQ